MVSYIKSACISGISGKIVEVETDITNGLPYFELVGLSGKVANEAKERVRSAIKNSGFMFPMNRITVNIFPAELRKEGSQFDLAIAMGILAATKQITLQGEVVKSGIFVGELTLDGRVNPIKGALPIVLEALKNKCGAVVLPEKNAGETAYISEVDSQVDSKTIIRMIVVRDLTSAIAFAEDCSTYEFDARHKNEDEQENIFQNKKSKKAKEDFSDIKGQKAAKRALEIAAAGNHNCIILGSPGSGKSMLARRIPSILPEMTAKEKLETGVIYSIAGMLDETGISKDRPLRSPHHGVTSAALAGGGSYPKPGEISLAHNGVLFLDEICEFESYAIDMLREPLELGYINISRKNGSIYFPSDFMLVAAANPCKCGMLYEKKCRCTPKEFFKYQGKLSGAIMDRIDIRIEVSSAGISTFRSDEKEESSQTIRARVNRARAIQLERFKNDGITSNSQMDSNLVKKYVLVNARVLRLLEEYEKKNGISLRGCVSVMKVARTIADLEGLGDVSEDNIAEALQYRVKEI